MEDPASGTISIGGQTVVAARGVAHCAKGDIRSVALRPEAVSLGEPGEGRNRLDGRIDEVSFLGAVVRVRVRVADHTLSMDTFNNPGRQPPERGQAVTIGFGRDDLLVLEGAA